MCTYMCMCVCMMWCCVMLVALALATMQQATIAVISPRSCKHHGSLKSHISPIGLGATFVIV